MKNITIILILFLLTLATTGLAAADSTTKPAVNSDMATGWLSLSKPTHAHRQAQGVVPATEIISPTLQLLTILPQPSSEGEHALAYNPQQDVAMLYGGNSSGHPYNSDSWQWHDADWQQLTPANQPPARYGAAAGFLSDGQLILFGGSDEHDIALDQSWVYTANDWLQLESAFHPPARTYPAVANDADALYLFGGNDGSIYHQDLWRYEAGSWSCLACAASPKPSARTLSAMALDPVGQQLWLFGGQDEHGNALADLWVFDMGSQHWQELLVASPGPAARWGHSLTYDLSTETLWLIGGTPDDETILAESWRYQAGSWQLATTEPAVAYHQTVMLSDQRLLVVGQGQSWLYQLEETANLLAAGNFESGSFNDWEQPYPGITVERDSARSGDYGIQLNGRGRIDYTFETIPGQSYQLSAWLRIDEVISPPSWGGLWLHAVDLPSWQRLGRSAYLHAGSHPFGQAIPLNEWHYVTFSFEAVGSTSRIVYQNFSNGELVASADDFQIIQLEQAAPRLLARARSRIELRYHSYLPLIMRTDEPGVSERALAEQLLAWEQAWANGDPQPLPPDLIRAYALKP